MLKTPLLSWPGKLRALGEVLLPKGYGQSQPGGDESLHRFIERRLGSEMAERIAAPLLSGIFAGDARELSAQATFPQLCRLEELHGSLIRGFFASQAKQSGADGEPSLGEIWRWLNRAAQNPQSPFVSFRGGMSVLVEALASKLKGSLRVGIAAKALVQTPSGHWQVSLDDGEILEAEAVVLATAAHVSAKLLVAGGTLGHKRLLETLASVPYRSTATVFFALAREHVGHPLDGLGFISDGSDSLIAGTWVSSKWEHRAPQGKVLIRGFLGGTKQVEQSSDDELVERAKAGLERLMGPLGQPLFSQVFRHVRASPQLLVGHPARVERVRSELDGAKGLYMAGAAFEGIGIPDCVDQARRQSAALVKELC
jgi:oxygen-dependent protoporphyrinogen oxidase